MKLLILRGIPGSGKTTYAMQWLKKGDKRARVSRDDIRMQCFGVEYGCDEDAVTLVEHHMIVSLLFTGHDVVVDATNINMEYLQKLIFYASLTNAKGSRPEVEIKVIDTPLEVALARNAARNRRVPEDVIRKFHEELELTKDFSV